MKRMIYGAVAVAGLCAISVFWFQYDRWFIYPPLRAHVNNQMKDPGSTQYRNEHMTKAGWLCGEMNSKNGMGGYVGFKRFMAGSADDSYLEGYGHIGKDLDTVRVMENLNTKVAILRARNDLQKSSGTSMHLSEAELEEMVAKEVFEKQWQQICQ